MKKNTTANSSSDAFYSILTKKYWISGAEALKSTRILALTALFIALKVVVGAFFIPVGESLRIYASFFVVALGSLVYGPLVALVAGFAGDIIGFFLFPSGAFFPGYTLSAMLGAFIYALFFYRSRITLFKIFLCKAIINIFVNIGLGSLWNSILMGKGFYYYFAKSVVKNLLLLPIEVLLLYWLFKAILPSAAKAGLIPKDQASKISFF